MFSEFAQYRGVIVTGAHRSGTTIAGRIIAYELDRPYTTESQVRREQKPRVYPELIREWMDSQPGPWVFHGPSCFRFIENLQEKDIATVFVRRDHGEIRASQIRKKGGVFCNPADCHARWKQKPICNPYEIWYRDLKGHKLFCEDRSDWGYRQIGPDEDAFNTWGGR